MGRIQFSIAGGGGVGHVSRDWPEKRQEVVNIFESLVRAAQNLEAIGFDILFMGEHQNDDASLFSAPATWMGVIAQHTSRLKFGAMGFQLPMHNPVRLAQEIALVDQISHGRAEVGIAYGSTEHEYVRWNVPFSERRAMSMESLEIMKLAWTQECFTYHGKYWSFDEALPWPPPFQQPHPRVWSITGSPETLEYAARMNHCIVLGGDPDEVIAEKHRTWEGMWKENGHTGPRPLSLVSRNIYVADTDEQALKEVEPYILRRAQNMAQQRSSTLSHKVSGTKVSYMGGNKEDTPLMRQRQEMNQRLLEGGLPAWLSSGMVVAGSPETVARRVLEQQKLIGFDAYLTTILYPGMPAEQIARTVQLFGEEVIPRVNKATEAIAAN